MKEKRPPNFQRYLYGMFITSNTSSTSNTGGSNFRERIYREFQSDEDYQRRVYGSFRAEGSRALLYGYEAAEAADNVQELYGWFQAVLESVMAAFMLLVFVFNVSTVVGSSMEPTMRERDRVIISSLFYSPNYGDIVALWAKDLPNKTTGEKGEMIVKRIIGLEGDVIDIDPFTGTVYRNGEALEEDYIMEKINFAHLGNAKYPLVVDKGCVFVLGDNRNHSTDSRYVDDGTADYYVGCVDKRCIVGKVTFRVFPLDRIGVVE